MYIDKMLPKVLSWIDAMIAFVTKFSHIFVIGFLAMMVSKVVKLNVKVGK